ncbi:hypothetical protein [Archangium primigenium]|uniref:hypothetical protein n=1 Tax=[Archangium] primigenium TaxID=2792470 RepID=UPI00195988DC|nr:hypothetical protein [Archangium primigenium]MBM7113850.1 hypothetical protein [Archangium primigenium]
MKKTLLMAFVSGLLLAACGAPGPEELQIPTDELATSQSALCEGWDSGARRCSFKCYSDSTWWTTTSGTVAHNQCQEFANNACGRTAYGACWSK